MGLECEVQTQHIVLMSDQELLPLAIEGLARTTSSIGCREMRWLALEPSTSSVTGEERAWDESCSRETDLAFAARWSLGDGEMALAAPVEGEGQAVSVHRQFPNSSCVCRLTLSHPMTPYGVVIINGNLYGEFNTTRYTLVHDFWLVFLSAGKS